MQRQTRIATWCERIIEGGWLFALIFIPSYFNLLSSRHFEPDKATTLRAIVTIMLAAALIRWVERLSTAPVREQAAPAGRSLWRRITAFPMGLPVLLYVLVFLIATIFSISPGVSFWGSYQRLQGTYTNLSYVALGTLIAFNLRTREQLNRLVGALVLGSIPVAAYGLIQHLQLDPLPWQGDVVSRVATTMGNSIFASAYLILVLPFALARGIGALSEARRAPLSEQPLNEWLWGIAYALLIIGGLMLGFAALEFGAVVRSIDLRYWWIYPGALICIFSLFLIPILRPHAAERSNALLWPGILTLGYVLLVGALFTIGQSGGQTVSPNPGRPGIEWPFWMITGFALAAVGFGLVFMLARRGPGSPRVLLSLQGIAMLAIAVVLLVTIVFTQSRGPWIGGFLGLYVFVTALLYLALRHARAAGLPSARLWGTLLVAGNLVVIAVIAFVVFFNFSNAPFFEQLRNVPYIGRMGRLLEVDTGTGLVRKLIWVGDEKAGGAVALILSNPVRTVIGWGPETMFVAYNPFYPPSLANIESRGASPDRSHMAYLDELINKGALGLASYIFVLVAFFTLTWRLIRKSTDVTLQLLLVAAASAIVAHAVEGSTGIPIVATLMVAWITIGTTVAAGRLIGEYQLEEQPAPAPAAAPAATSAPAPAAPARSGQQGRRQSGRRREPTPRGAQSGGRASSRQSSPAGGMLLIYAVLLLCGLGSAWFLNVDNVYADMRFQQGQTYTEDPQADLDRYIFGTYYYLDAIRMEPDQDFYYLNLGRSLMSIVDIRRQSGVDLGQPRSDVRIGDLLALNEPFAVQQFVTQQTPLGLMSYAEAVLMRAEELSPRNKDHYANMARMYNFWYTRLGGDSAKLEQSVEWYKRGVEIAPQDVSILNEYASAIATQGSDAQKRGDQAGGQQLYAEAEQILARSAQIDPRYQDTNTRLAEVLRLSGQYDRAVALYIEQIKKNTRAIDSQIPSIIATLQGRPELLLQIRNVYEEAALAKPGDVANHALIGLIAAQSGDLPRAVIAFGEVVKLQPDNIEARQNYTIVLSDSLQYTQAVAEAQTLIQLAQAQGATQEDIAGLQGLLMFLQQKAAGG